MVFDSCDPQPSKWLIVNANNPKAHSGQTTALYKLTLYDLRGVVSIENVDKLEEVEGLPAEAKGGSAVEWWIISPF